MVLPCFQGGGYGKRLIEMSYELSMVEGKFGTPERPLSDLGHRAYVAFWTRRLVTKLIEYLNDKDKREITIPNLVRETGMIESDINYILDHHKIRQD